MVCCRDINNNGSHAIEGHAHTKPWEADKSEKKQKNKKTATTFNALWFLSLFVYTHHHPQRKWRHFYSWEESVLSSHTIKDETGKLLSNEQSQPGFTANFHVGSLCEGLGLEVPLSAHLSARSPGINPSITAWPSCCPVQLWRQVYRASKVNLVLGRARSYWPTV